MSGNIPGWLATSRGLGVITPLKELAIMVFSFAAIVPTLVVLAAGGECRVSSCLCR